MTAKSLYAGMAGLVLLAGCASGAPARPSDFARRVATLVEGSDVPGLAVAVVHHGELVYAHGFGWRDPARTAPMTVDTVQMWFSCSKIVTATAAVRLAQQGRLDLDRPLVSYLADHGLRGPGVERLTARHLLSHTSGLPNPIPLRWMRLDSEIAEPRTDFYRRLIAEHGELRSLPGETMAYSNLNYLVLARVIEVTSGQSFEDYVQDQVLMPLGMRRTGFGPADRWGEDVAVPAMKEWRPYTWAVEWMVDGKILSGSAHGERAGLGRAERQRARRRRLAQHAAGPRWRARAAARLEAGNAAPRDNKGRSPREIRAGLAPTQR